MRVTCLDSGWKHSLTRVWNVSQTTPEQPTMMQKTVRIRGHTPKRKTNGTRPSIMTPSYLVMFLVARQLAMFPSHRVGRNAILTPGPKVWESAT